MDTYYGEEYPDKKRGLSNKVAASAARAPLTEGRRRWSVLYGPKETEASRHSRLRTSSWPDPGRRSTSCHPRPLGESWSIRSTRGLARTRGWSRTMLGFAAVRG